MIDVLQVATAGLLASIVWFILGSVLYVNPWVAKIYKEHEGAPGLKTWKNQKQYIITMYFIGALIPCLIFALVYAFISPAFSSNVLTSIICLGLILTGVRVIPRFFDMWIQSTYPDTLLAIEIFNGTILSFAAAAVLVWMI